MWRKAHRNRLNAALPVVEAGPTDLYLGIDGGGTHTVALIGPRGRPGAGRPLDPSRPRRGWSLESSAPWVAGRALDALDGIGDQEAFRRGRGLETQDPSPLPASAWPGPDGPEDQAIIRSGPLAYTLAASVEVTGGYAVAPGGGHDAEGWGRGAGRRHTRVDGVRCGNPRGAGRPAPAGWALTSWATRASGYALVLAALQAVVRAADGAGQQTDGSHTPRALPCLRDLGLTQTQETDRSESYRGGLDRTGAGGAGPRSCSRRQTSAMRRRPASFRQGAEQLADNRRLPPPGN